jgi:glycosyltransferase involved in cell wall biosynthesis
MTSILAVGPSPLPITGQSKAFNFFVKNSGLNVKVLFCTGNITFYSVFYIFKLFWYFLFFKFDVVYFTSSRSHMGFVRDFLVLFLFGYVKRIKVVNHLHGADFKFFRTNSNIYFKRIIDWSYGYVSTSIVLNSAMKKEYSCYPKMKIVVVPNFSERFLERSQVTSKKINNSSKLDVLFLSNLIESKGLFELVEAVISFNNFNERICLHIAGSSLGNKEIENKLIEKCKNHQFIKYYGPLSGDSKFRLLKECHVLALPTYYPTEAQPICVIEGMAFGCVILSTNHNYMPELVDDTNGIIVKIKSSKSICTAFKSIFDRVDEYNVIMLGNLAHAKEQFLPSIFINNINNILIGERYE